MVLGEMGFAVASPLLELADGRRTVTLEVVLKDPAARGAASPALVVQFSGSDGWIDVEDVTASWASDSVLRIRAVLESSSPAVVPCAADRADGFPPVAIMRVRIEQGDSSSGHPRLLGAEIARLCLSVSVEGARSIALANDAGPLMLHEPVALFGRTPSCGASLFLGAPEALKKPLSRLSLRLRWRQLPPGPAEQADSGNQTPPSTSAQGAPRKDAFQTYYAGYALAMPGQTDSLFDDDSFQVGLQYRVAGEWTDLVTVGRPTLPLYQRREDGSLSDVTVLALEASPGARLNIPAEETRTEHDTRLPPTGVMRLQLMAPAFGFGSHLYPPAVSALALRHAEALVRRAQGQNVDPVVETLPPALNPPYVPVLEDLELSYRSSVVSNGLPGEALSLHSFGVP